MARKLKTDREVAKLRKPGKHSLGGNLVLQVSSGGSRSFVARVTCGKRRVDIGLGSYPVTTLARARDKVRQVQQAIAEGKDPKQELNPEPSPTFEEMARRLHGQLVPTFKNVKHCAQWINTLDTYAFPIIGKIPVDEINHAKVMPVLEPIWTSKQETARRVLQRIASVVQYAIGNGFGDTELAVNVIRKALPAQNRQVRHHPACSKENVPSVYRQLGRENAMSAKALQFLMLTAARSMEVRGAEWSEIDFDEKVWIIPASRMKAGREHKVPLSGAAIDVIRSLPPHLHSDRYIFPNEQGRPLSDTALSKTFKKIAPGCTIHGCRSTFKDWVLEETDYRDEISELALAHVNSDKTRAAYARSDLLAKRRLLMEDWGAFLCPR